MIPCAGGCKRTTEEPEKAGWSYLFITGRYRCGQCEADLRKAGEINGSGSAQPDLLPPSSIGALKKLPEPIELHEKVKP